MTLTPSQAAALKEIEQRHGNRLLEIDDDVYEWLCDHGLVDEDFATLTDLGLSALAEYERGEK